MGKKLPLKNVLKARYPEKTEKEIYTSVICGEVFVNNEKINNPGKTIDDHSSIEIKKEREFVSRGGIKLKSALNIFETDISGRVFIDAGCSTGGFTDCLLKKNAKRVYAVDVGYNVLDYKIRSDSRVTVFERTNIMNVNKNMLEETPYAAVMDLSFRSIKGAVSHLMNLVKDKLIISLIKPQFEWQNPKQDFNGIIEDKKIVHEILKSLIDKIADEKCYAVNICESPILGRRGNHEYFFMIKNKEEISRENILTLLDSIVLK